MRSTKYINHAYYARFQ